MEYLMDWLRRPWPWYIAGPLIGLTVPALLIIGNKRLGISSSLRHICAACVPADIRYLRYDWKKQSWNIYFVVGILIGGLIAGQWLANLSPVAISAQTVTELQGMGVQTDSGLLPLNLFNWHALTSPRGLILMVLGGFMVGFGTRYAGGCTSGHGIMGLSALQWPSLVAVASFFLGGIVCSYFILPYVLKLG
jgi:uncharacterized membrane protein YedE/YeeE